MEAESRGLRIPHDLAVIGFGDLDFAASNRPSITTVSVDRRAIGQRAATLLADRIEQKPCAEAIVDIGFHLIERVRINGNMPSGSAGPDQALAAIRH